MLVVGCFQVHKDLADVNRNAPRLWTISPLVYTILMRRPDIEIFGGWRAERA
jgi:hypothetical protein